jgi:hypothetical protein
VRLTGITRVAGGRAASPGAVRGRLAAYDGSGHRMGAAPLVWSTPSEGAAALQSFVAAVSVPRGRTPARLVIEDVPGQPTVGFPPGDWPSH